MFVFLICATQCAGALQAARPQDYRDIQSQIDKKLAAENEIKSLTVDLSNTRGNEAKEREIKTELSRLSKVQKDAAEQALWLTIRAYDIIPFADNEPMLDDGISVLRSPEKGKRIAWLPIFEKEGRKELQDEFGNYAGFRTVGPRNAGNTASDGISRIFPAAFDSPVQLASFIIHEQVHFTQNTTRGKGDVKTTAELEVEAYEAELRLLNDSENVLGYSDEIKRIQLKNLTEILDGRKGKKGEKDAIGKRKLALDERAALIRSGALLPAPERSFPSHSEEELKRLAKEAREQIAIVQRDHDDRLRAAVIALSLRSCDSPGSVSRAELLELPRPHFHRYWTTGIPNRCFDEYRYIAEGGTDSMLLRSISTPPPNAQVPPSVGPVPLHPIKPKFFNSIFPDIKEYVIAACRGLRRDPPIHSFYGDYSMMDNDENDARRLMVGQGVCAQQLFYRIIGRTRANGGYFSLTSKWVDGVIKENTPAPVTAPPYVDPTPAPPGGGRRCEDYGVVNCPK